MTTVLVTGGSGFIGSKVTDALRVAGYSVGVTFHEHGARAARGEGAGAFALDLCDTNAALRLLRELRPGAVVHLAAMSELAACERDPGRAERVNVTGTRVIAQGCEAVGAALLFASTDQVFDGEHAPYGETDAPEPIHVYGRTKLRAETEVASLGERGLSLRLSLVYGESPTGMRSASEQVMNAIARGNSPRLFVDEFRTPILVDDVAAVVVELVERMLAGDSVNSGGRVLHLGGPDRVSRYEFGQRMAEAFGFDEALLTAARLADVALGAPRPRDLSMNSSLAKGALQTRIRGVRDGLAFLAATHARDIK